MRINATKTPKKIESTRQIKESHSVEITPSIKRWMY